MPKSERCIVCEEPIRMIVMSGTGFCSANCEDIYNEDK